MTLALESSPARTDHEAASCAGDAACVLICCRTPLDVVACDLNVLDFARGLVSFGHLPVVYSAAEGAGENETRNLVVPYTNNLSSITVQPQVVCGTDEIALAIVSVRFPRAVLIKGAAVANKTFAGARGSRAVNEFPDTRGSRDPFKTVVEFICDVAESKRREGVPQDVSFSAGADFAADTVISADLKAGSRFLHDYARRVRQVELELNSVCSEYGVKTEKLQQKRDLLEGVSSWQLLSKWLMNRA